MGLFSIQDLSLQWATSQRGWATEAGPAGHQVSACATSSHPQPHQAHWPWAEGQGSSWIQKVQLGYAILLRPNNFVIKLLLRLCEKQIHPVQCAIQAFNAVKRVCISKWLSLTGLSTSNTILGAPTTLKPEWSHISWNTCSFEGSPVFR